MISKVLQTKENFQFIWPRKIDSTFNHSISYVFDYIKHLSKYSRKQWLKSDDFIENKTIE